MCDYSLHLTASRPARVGDKLVSTRFPHTITRGFASLEERNVAVCLLSGTELAFEEEVACETRSMFRPQRELGYKMATFRQINKDRSDTHHDALEFPDGQVVLLTQLSEGQHATVLQVPASHRQEIAALVQYNSVIRNIEDQEDRGGWELLTIPVGQDVQVYTLAGGASKVSPQQA